MPFLIALSGFFLALLLKRLGKIRFIFAVCLAILVLDLPGFTNGVVDLATSPMNIYNIPFVLGSYALWYRWGETGSLTKKGRRRILLLFAAAVLLYCSITIYQPFSTFFLCLTLFRYLYPREDDLKPLRNFVAKDVAFFGIVAWLYFMVHRFVVLPILAAQNPYYFGYFQNTNPDIKNYRFMMSLDPVENIKQILEIYDKSFGIWLNAGRFDFFVKASLVAFCAILIYYLIMIIRERRDVQRNLIANRHVLFFLEYVSVVLFLVVSICVVLAIPKAPDIYNNRSLVPTMTAFVFMFSRPIYKIYNASFFRDRRADEKWTQFLNVFVLSATCVLALSTRDLIERKVDSFIFDHVSLIEKSRNYDPRIHKKIDILYPIQPQYMIKLYRYPLDWSNGLIAEILSHHGKRINLRTPPPVREMDIRTIPRDTYFTPQNTLILSEIDPSHPYDALKTRGMIKGVRLHFLTVSSPDHSGLVDAFDPSLQGGLSVVNPSWPVVIEDRMVGDPVGDLRSYSLRYGGGDSPFRPTRWALQGSLDCSEWTTLDTRDEADASSDESGRGVRQDLTAAAGAKYRCFRFVIYNGASSDQLKIDAFQIQTASSGDVFSPSLKAP